MAIFGQYTGQRVSPLPSGFLGAAMQQAKMTKDTMTDIGDVLGNAIAGYGRQKKEERERAEKLAALRSHFDTGDTTASVMQGIEKARAMDSRMNTAAKQQHDAENLHFHRGFAEEKAIKLYQIDEKAAHNKAMADVLEKRVFGERETYKGKSAEGLPAPDLERWKTKPEALSPKKQIEAVAEMHRLREGLKDTDAQKKAVIDQYNRSIASTEYKPVRPNEDRILANPDQYAQEVVTEKGQLQEEAVNRLGPKLLGKMEKGDMTKADELLVIDILSNLRAEGDAARTPKGRLNQIALQLAEQKLKDEKGLRNALEGLSVLPGQQGVNVSEQVTPSNIEAYVNRRVEQNPDIDVNVLQDEIEGKLRAYQQSQTDELEGMPVGIPPVGAPKHWNPIDVYQESKKGAAGMDVEYRKRTGEERSPNDPVIARKTTVPGTDSVFAMQGDYAAVPGEPGVDGPRGSRWYEPKEVFAVMDRIEQQPLTQPQKRQQALQFIESQANKLGPAGLQAARVEVDRRYPVQPPAGMVPHQMVSDGKGGTQMTYKAPAPSGTTAQPILMSGPDGNHYRTGKAITPQGDVVDDPFVAEAGEDEAAVSITGKAGTFKGTAKSKQEAIAFRKQYVAASESIPMIDRLIEMSREGESELFGPKLAKATAIQNILVGKLRIALTGGGPLTKEEREMIKSAVRNPYAFFSLEESNVSALEAVKESMLDAVNASAEAQGLQSVIGSPAQADQAGGGLSANPNFSRGPGGKLIPEKR